MKKYKARKEREQQEAIVRPRVEIEDPSEELLSQSRPWEKEDPLQFSFLEAPEVARVPRDYHRVPKLKFRCGSETPPNTEPVANSPNDNSQPHSVPDRRNNSTPDISATRRASPLHDLCIEATDPAPQVVAEPTSIEHDESEAPALPRRHPSHVHIKTGRSRSLPPTPSLAFSPPKASFQLFSARCAPSPTSASPLATTPVFELSAEEANFSLANVSEPNTPAELEAEPVDIHGLCPAPLVITPKTPEEAEPEASPYNRLTALAKSVHNINASLSTIAETEEEAASRRSSAQIFELPVSIGPRTLSSYMGGTSITPRVSYYNAMIKSPELETLPTRNISTRSSNSTNSTVSMHSIFSFEYSNSDSEKIYVAAPYRSRESSAPSLTDVSSLDDFDMELDLELDEEAQRSRSISKRDAKLERFFGIRQYSISGESEAGQGVEVTEPISPRTVHPPHNMSSAIGSISVHRRSSSLSSLASHNRQSSCSTVNDLDLCMALENDPYKKEMLSMKRSILSKSQNKQDRKLEKFFGCDKDQIQIARKCSTGSRLAGNNDDLQYRQIGW